ncbi:hypothetical protein DVH24_013366 [Malus domestica]|uniref:Uncharacterized protein n=1 Tax=Malus domestica TaxID=3750 RepID=A0A498HIT8_MALDO|nr:hypothetical protein DVH24_013366 [Malus domestica]
MCNVPLRKDKPEICASYAAAYTASEVYSSGGASVLRHSPFFTTFIITYLVSLINSLSSLVTFLSILTSQFEYKKTSINLFHSGCI